jgi:DNA-binding response OmpR family regulator
LGVYKIKKSSDTNLRRTNFAAKVNNGVAMVNNANEKKTIFLVDDDEIHLKTAELFLKNDYEIHKASSGDEALQCLNNREFTPDLIMLDIIMPNMTGWEVFKKIRALDYLKNVPIAFLTSLTGEEEKKKARQLGAADYIMKPFNMNDLKTRVKDALLKSRMR